MRFSEKKYATFIKHEEECYIDFQTNDEKWVKKEM